MPENNKTRIADAVSLAFNPFLLMPTVFLIGLFLTEFPTSEARNAWLGILLVINFLIPLWIIFYLDQRGFVLDDTLENNELHRKRLIALFPILLLLILEVIAMVATDIYQPLFAVFLSSIIVAAIGALISYYWKVSAHSLGLSATVTLLALLVGPWALIGLLIVPLLAWSRLVLERHTLFQVIIGTLIPPVIIVLVFQLLKV